VRGHRCPGAGGIGVTSRAPAAGTSHEREAATAFRGEVELVRLELV
jgi:hypothetical protein